MKYVKTFENFTYSINEEEGIFGDIYQKMKNFFTGLKDKAAQEVGEKIKSELESRKQNSFTFEKDQTRYLISHIALRFILSKYLNTSPKLISFILSV